MSHKTSFKALPVKIQQSKYRLGMGWHHVPGPVRVNRFCCLLQLLSVQLYLKLKFFAYNVQIFLKICLYWSFVSQFYPIYITNSTIVRVLNIPMCLRSPQKIFIFLNCFYFFFFLKKNLDRKLFEEVLKGIIHEASEMRIIFIGKLFICCLKHCQQHFCFKNKKMFI